MKKIINTYIKDWESKGYSDGIPDEVPVRLDQLNKAPSYKRICIAILSNDLSQIGVKRETSKYYHILKRIELEPNKKQLKLL